MGRGPVKRDETKMMPYLDSSGRFEEDVTRAGWYSGEVCQAVYASDQWVLYILSMSSFQVRGVM